MAAESIINSDLLNTLTTYGWTGVILGASPMIIKYIFKLKAIYDTKKKSDISQLTESIISPITKLTSSVDALASLVNERVGKIDTVVVSQQNVESQQRAMLKQLDAIVEDTGGEITEQQVINIVGIYSGKVNYELLLWWRDRIESNHILEQKEHVKKRYESELGVIVKRWLGEMGFFRYRGKTLGEWLDEGGLYAFYSDIMSDLFKVQFDLAEGKEPFFTIRGAKDYVERKQSELMGSSREWCMTGHTLSEYISKSKKIGQVDGSIKWMN